jgi:hypothetical protein
MKFISAKKRFVAVASAIVVTLGLSGAAFAYFTSTGTGTGTGTVNNTSVWALSSSPVTNIGPGLPAVNIVGTATNPAGQTEYIGTVTPSVTSTSNVGCTSADFTVTSGTINADTASGATGLDFGTIAFHDTGSNQNACEGVTVYLSFSSN